MVVTDFDGSHQVNSVDQLWARLKVRFEGANSFWITEKDGGFPVLVIAVKEDLAYVNYCPKEYDTGFMCIGDMSDSLEGDTTVFFVTKQGEPIWASNHSVIPIADAVAAATEFFSTSDLPKSLEWLKL